MNILKKVFTGVTALSLLVSHVVAEQLEETKTKIIQAHNNDAGAVENIKKVPVENNKTKIESQNIKDKGSLLHTQKATEGKVSIQETTNFSDQLKSNLCYSINGNTGCVSKKGHTFEIKGKFIYEKNTKGEIIMITPVK